MAANNAKVALVTGANKGIGYFIVHHLAAAQPGWTVLLGSRDGARGAEAVAKLNHANVKPITVNVDDVASLQAAAQEIQTRYGGLDVLVNNAGIAWKGDAFNAEVVDGTFKTNYYGLLHAIDTFLPLMRDEGRIVNVSSMMSRQALTKMAPAMRAKFLDAQLTREGLTALMTEFRDSVAAGNWTELGFPTNSYGMSKLGVSCITRILAKNLPRGITMNACCPGWCKTDMAGDKAPRSAEDGAATVAHIALLPPSDRTNGEFWEDKKVSSFIPAEQ